MYGGQEVFADKTRLIHGGTSESLTVVHMRLRCWRSVFMFELPDIAAYLSGCDALSFPPTSTRPLILGEY